MTGDRTIWGVWRRFTRSVKVGEVLKGLLWNRKINGHTSRLLALVVSVRIGTDVFWSFRFNIWGPIPKEKYVYLPFDSSRVSVIDLYENSSDIFETLIEHNWELTASLHRVLLCDQNVSSPLLALSHSREHGSGCSKIWQVYFHLRQLALAVTTLSALLLLFLFSLSHLCMTVFHYFEQNICHGFWKLLDFVSASLSWCTATFLCWIQCKCYTSVKVKSISIAVLRNTNGPKCHLMQAYKLILRYIAFFSKLTRFH